VRSTPLAKTGGLASPGEVIEGPPATNPALLQPPEVGARLELADENARPGGGDPARLGGDPAPLRRP
jgi:hypothetical protein